MVKVSVGGGGGEGEACLCAHLKKAIRFRCIKVHINKFVIYIRILSQE